MDTRFERIFREQAELYRASQVDPYDYPPLPRRPRLGDRYALRSLAIVDEALEEGFARAARGRKLRSDARVFLLTNLHQMAALPVSHPDSPTSIDVLEEGQLEQDVQTIVAAALEQSRGDRLSAADMLRATASVLEELNLKSWRLWDSDE